MRKAAARHTAYVVDGLELIREVEADIVVCDKVTYAQWPSAGRLRRGMLGTTVFYSKKAAIARKLGILRKAALVALPYWHPAGQVAVRAQAPLAKYEETKLLS